MLEKIINKKLFWIILIVIILIIIVFMFSKTEKSSGIVTFVTSSDNTIEYQIDINGIEEKEITTGIINLDKITPEEFIATVSASEAELPSLKKIIRKLGQIFGFSKVKARDNGCVPTIDPSAFSDGTSVMGVSCGFTF